MKLKCLTIMISLSLLLVCSGVAAGEDKLVSVSISDNTEIAEISEDFVIDGEASETTTETTTTTTTMATTMVTTTTAVAYSTAEATTKTTAKTTAKATTTKKATTSLAFSYTEDELYMMSHLIYGEAGNQSDEVQQYVGSVVLNRMKHSSFPDTMEEVIFQSGQYACTWDGNYKKTPSQQAIDNAKYLLAHGSVLPENVVYQAQFTQGSGVYKKLGNTYFCYA